MKASELTKKLKKSGCRLAEHGSKHDKWFSPITNKYVRVPRHKSQDVPSGTADRILKDAGLK